MAVLWLFTFSVLFCLVAVFWSGRKQEFKITFILDQTIACNMYIKTG